MIDGFPPAARFEYDRKGALLHLVTQSMTNHEMRTILVGFWLTLDEADRLDHLAELQHYLLRRSSPPAASLQIADAIIAARKEDA